LPQLTQQLGGWQACVTGLKPVFETRVRRTVFQIQSGDSEVDVSIDKGTVEAGHRKEHVEAKRLSNVEEANL
jgi:inorganic triphosphatase YgiF